MPQVRIERKKTGMTTVARTAVKPGQVFQKVVGKDGKLGDKLYIDVGNNGKSLSINAQNGELASSVKPDGRVVVVGKAKFTVNYLPASDRRSTTRGQVRNGEVFKVKGGDKSYVHLGTLNAHGNKGERLCSLNLADPFNEDYATTGNRSSSVEVIGVAAIDVETV